jgi:L-histidine Nalpha-methyltransferase
MSSLRSSALAVAQGLAQAPEVAPANNLEFAQAMCAGLAARPRALSPQWFYDLEGSQLFERICELPEYYPTRVETALLVELSGELAALIGAQAEIVEFGAGAARKVRILLTAMQAAGQPALAYRPLDVSAEFLHKAAQGLRCEFPSLAVHPQVADINQALQLPPLPPLPRAAHRVGFYPGSSIGNFEPAHAQALLQRMRLALAGGGLLIGVDLVKDPARLHAAYNDSAGVTAAFNLNLLARANRELEANFDLRAWAHSAFYNPAHKRIEMHLVSRCEQTVHIGALARGFHFAEGDSVHTECSYKYTVAGFQALARSAGWRPRVAWCDDAKDFSLHWLVAA